MCVLLGDEDWAACLPKHRATRPAIGTSAYMCTLHTSLHSPKAFTRKYLSPVILEGPLPAPTAADLQELCRYALEPLGGKPRLVLARAQIGRGGAASLLFQALGN